MKSCELYQQLFQLTTEENSAFYLKDEVCLWDGFEYRTFLYRLASWTEFKKPSAVESRGIMFRKESSEWVLVSRPFQKFFNMGEIFSNKKNDITNYLKFLNVAGILSNPNLQKLLEELKSS